MSKIEQLIKEKCPNGVKILLISDILISYSSGLNPRQNFKLNDGNAELYYVTVKEITSGKIAFSDKTDRITKEAWEKIQTRSKLEKDDILISAIGTIGKVALADIDIHNWNCSESVILLKPNKHIVSPKYLVHLLRSRKVQDQWKNHSVGSTLKGLRKENILNTKISVPPIEVQEEIVRILDEFSELEAELEAELEIRKKQYKFWLNRFFNNAMKKFNNVKMGTFAKIQRGGGFQKKDFVTQGKPCIHYGQIYTHYGTFTYKPITYLSDECYKKQKKAHQNDIIMAVTSENMKDVCKTVAWLGDEEIAVSGHSAIISSNQNAKYLSYFFQSKCFQQQKIKYARGVKVIEVSPNKLNEIKVPLPPLREQERIVKILDKFDNLVNYISEGIPAEIEARRKQYEYYRNKLLSFKEIKE